LILVEFLEHQRSPNPCFVSVYVIGSELVGSLEQVFSREPQNYQAKEAGWWSLCRLWCCPFSCQPWFGNSYTKASYLNSL